MTKTKSHNSNQEREESQGDKDLEGSNLDNSLGSSFKLPVGNLSTLLLGLTRPGSLADKSDPPVSPEFQNELIQLFQEPTSYPPSNPPPNSLDPASASLPDTSQINPSLSPLQVNFKTIGVDGSDSYRSAMDRLPSNYDPNHSTRLSHLFPVSHCESSGGERGDLSDGSYGTFQSGFEVILDSGKKVKRTVSVSDHPPDYSPNFTSMYKAIPRDEDIIEEEEAEPLEQSNSSTPSASLFTNLMLIFSPITLPYTFISERLSSLPPSQKYVLKATLSYFLGCLLTFLPPMRHLIGTSSHMASISMFFLNPSQSIGMFMESMAFCVLFVVYGLIVGYLSLVNMAFWNNLGMVTTAKVTTWLVFIGVASFVLAFIKARFQQPSVGRCIPNAFIFIFIVLMNYAPFVETTFSSTKTLDLAKALSAGILINFVICTQLWPRWEADKLRVDMINCLESFRNGLGVVVKTFLLEELPPGVKIDAVMNLYRTQLQTLNERYESAQYEFYFEPAKYQAMGKVVDRLARLGQKLGGLSSGIDAQKELVQAKKKGVRMVSKRWSKLKEIDSIDPNQMDSLAKDGKRWENEDSPDLNVLTNFLKLTGPPTKSLAFTCRQAMAHLIQQVTRMTRTTDLPHLYSHPHPFYDADPEDESLSPDFTAIPPAQLKSNIRSALSLFSTARSKAMTNLYKKTTYSGRPTEEIFLVYFFMFSMEEFANELLLTIESIDQLSGIKKDLHWSWWYRIVTSVFALFSVWQGLATRGLRKLGLAKKEDVNEPRPEGVTPLGNDQDMALHNPDPHTVYQWIRAKAWYFFMSLRDHDVKFAIKSSLAVLLVSSPAYFFGYAELFKDLRVAWTLITINLVMSPTVGASSAYGIYRFTGSVVGSAMAYLVYSLLSHNLLGLVIVSTLIACPCLHLFINSDYPRFGQFLLLSYNLVVLTTYANRNDVEFSFERYALIRALGVSAGVLIGLIFSFFVLPYEARRELRLGLSTLFLEINQLYIELCKAYSPTNPTCYADQYQPTDSDHQLSEISLLNEHPAYLQSVRLHLVLEQSTQAHLLELTTLLTHTSHEPRLKGPFPIQAYESILKSCQVVLNKLISMRVMVTNSQWQEKVIKDFVIPLNSYRPDLVGNLTLYIYLLASALVLKSPLPPYLPPVKQARARLIGALRDLPVVRDRILMDQNDDHHIVYYAFIVVLGDVIDELDDIADQVKSLYGHGQDSQFVNLFALPS